MDERECDLNAYLSDIEEAEQEIDRLERENQILRIIAKDLHWMARRYADGRMTYAANTVNGHARALLAMGVELNPTGDRTIWARDGMGRLYDGLTDDEAAQGAPLEMWRYSVLTEGFEQQ